MMGDVTASEEAARAWFQRPPNAQRGFPHPDKVAELALWLPSPQNTLLVGQTLFADLGSAVLQHGLSPLLETGAGGATQ